MNKWTPSIPHLLFRLGLISDAQHGDPFRTDLSLFIWLYSCFSILTLGEVKANLQRMQTPYHKVCVVENEAYKDLPPALWLPPPLKWHNTKLPPFLVSSLEKMKYDKAKTSTLPPFSYAFSLSLLLVPRVKCQAYLPS